MSKPRAFFSFTTVCSAALVAARVAIWMFPLQTPAQTPQISAQRSSTVSDGPGVVVEPGAKIMHRSPVFFPQGVTASGIVIVESSVNAKGEVTDAHVVSGPEELRSTVLSSVLNWHFSTEGGLPPTVQSTIRFTSTPRVTLPAPIAVAHTANARLKAIRMNGLSDDTAEKVRAAISVHVGDPFGNDDLSRVREAVKEIDKHMMVGMGSANGDVTLTFALPPDASGSEGVLTVMRDEMRGIITAQSTAPAPTAVANFPATPGAARIRVGGNVEAANLMKKVTPMYPPLAKQARIQGTVRFSVLIDREGKIAEIQLIEGHPLLAESAMEAVKQWQYHPTMLNGEPAEVVTVIDVNFTLTQ